METSRREIGSCEALLVLLGMAVFWLAIMWAAFGVVTSINAATLTDFQAPTSSVPLLKCTMVYKPYTLAHQKGDKYILEEIEDWRIPCTITRDDKIVYNNPDIAPSHPIKFDEGMKAINEFRTKTAPKILGGSVEGKKDDSHNN